MKISPTRTFKAILSNDFVRKTGNAIAENPGKFVIANILIKDSINTYYYYTQSLNNKEIPEKKRKYVASLDLMNGALNQILQLSIGLAIARKGCQGLLASKLMGNWLKDVGKEINIKDIKQFKGVKKLITVNGEKKYKEVNYVFNRENADEVYKKLRNPGNKNEVYKDWENKVAFGRIGIEVITSLGLTTIVGKRMLTPLIATPLASWYKDKFLHDTPPAKPYTIPEQHLNQSNAIAFYKQLRNNHLKTRTNINANTN